jgi:hypothetical protein
MTAIKRLGAAAITMVALGTLGLPASAMAGKSHHLKLYKVEQHIDIEGDLDYTISCNPGDIATDGMWRIDDVSQDNEFDTLGQWTQTVAIKSTTVAANEQDYVFRFLPIAGGDVQGKLWVTCLENPVTGNGHTHHFNTRRITSTQTAITAPTTSQSYTVGPGSGGGDHVAGYCPKGTYVPIAPGFDLTTTDGYGYVQKNWDATTGTDVAWEWKFNVASAGPATDAFTAKLSYRCLELRSDLGGVPAHRHRIVQQYKSKSSLPVLRRTFRTHEVQCGEHYKGMVGEWWVSDYHLYYLGMDPRIKARAFKFVNPEFLNDYTVDLKLSCFKDRTT